MTSASIASDLIERLRNDEVRQGPDADPLCVEAAEALSQLTREVDEANRELQCARANLLSANMLIEGLTGRGSIAIETNIERIDEALSRSNGRVSDATE